jgi:hypothetical protein
MNAASLLYAKSVVAVISCFGDERFTFLHHFLSVVAGRKRGAAHVAAF